MTKLKNLFRAWEAKMNSMTLWILLGIHILANLVCWLRWSLVSKQGVLKWIVFGLVAGLIPTWPDSMTACEVLSIIFVAVEAAWTVFNFKAAEDYCLNKTINYHPAEELIRYAPGSE